MVLKMRGELRQYEIVGRRLPSQKEAKPRLCKMRIFSPNHVSAKSRFWYYMSKLRNVKKAHGEVVGCKEVFERKPGSVKNYGVWLRYDSRTNTVNMYREYRDTTVTGAITQAYRDMGARHRARADVIHILKVQAIAPKECKRASIRQFLDADIKFPLTHRVAKRRNMSQFAARRPRTHFK